MRACRRRARASASSRPRRESGSCGPCVKRRSALATLSPCRIRINRAIAPQPSAEKANGDAGCRLPSPSGRSPIALCAFSGGGGGEPEGELGAAVGAVGGFEAAVVAAREVVAEREAEPRADARRLGRE